MSFRDILAVVASAEGDAAAVAAARAVASASGGRVTVLLVEIEPEPTGSVEFYIMSEVWAQVSARAHDANAQMRAQLQTELSRLSPPVALRSISMTPGFVQPRLGVEARCADLAVVVKPVDGAPLAAVRKSAFEGVLFGSGRPCLLVPLGWKPGVLGKSVVVGWNGKREAARALADAVPLLKQASKITLVSVDERPDLSGHTAASSGDIAAHLARRGLAVEVRNVDGRGREEGKALLEECTSLDADLLVLGGYGRARLQETVFGGVTRSVLKDAHLPVLMSH